MTAIENLRALKLQLEHQLKGNPSAADREWIEGELMKIDIALSFLNDVKQPSEQPVSK
jgi:hypothetical protein